MGTVFYIVVAVLVVLITSWIRMYVKNRRFWRLLDDFYGYKALPFIGNTHQLGTTTEDFLWNCYEIFKKANYSTYKMILGKDVLIALCEPETIEVLLSNNKEITKMEEYTFFKDWLGDGLLLSTGAKWRLRRKIITPTFHFRILEQFIKIFNDNGDIFINQLKMKVKQGEAFDVNPFVNVCTLDVICESAMGVKVNAQIDSESEYVKAVHGICLLLKQRIFSPIKRITWYYKLTSDYRQCQKFQNILHNMTKSVISKRKEILKDQIEKVRNGEALLESQDDFLVKRKKVAFLDLLLLTKLPDGSFLSDEEIREEVDTFMFAGHDTTASAVGFALYSLANNPDVQQKALDEILDAVGDDPKKELIHEILHNLKYLEMVIKETLRLYPSVTAYGRRLQNDMTLPDGRIMPAGSFAWVDAFALGRNPRCHPDFDQFDPERFSPENLTGKNPYLFVSFSAGSRNCIGQKFAMLEVKSILVKALLNFELISAGPDAKLRLTSEIILKTVTGVPIIIKERKLK